MILAILKWVLLSITGMVVTALAMLLAPVLPFFVQPDGYLPGWLSWFQTPDNPAFGDRQFHDTQMSWTRCKYLWTVFWLWRNPAYGFDAAVLCTQVLDGFVYVSSGDELVSNMPLHNGWVFRKVLVGNTTYWQLYIVHGWSDVKCLRINLGWKLWGSLKAGQTRPLVISINPWMKCG